MACQITYKGKRYSEPEFFALLVAGEYDKLVAEGKFEPKKLTNTSTTERIQQENRAADVNGTEESEFLKNFKENITTPINIKEMLEVMGVSKDTLANSKVIEQANEALAEYKDIDNIKGSVSVKDLYVTDDNILFKEVMKTPLFVPENISPYLLLEKFKQTKIHTSFVVDEYGTLLGLVTLNDVSIFCFAGRPLFTVISLFSIFITFLFLICLNIRNLFH
jgi:hypothetical protein